MTRQTTQADIDALRAELLKDVPPQSKATATAIFNIALDTLTDLSSIASSFERIAVAMEKQRP